MIDDTKLMAFIDRYIAVETINETDNVYEMGYVNSLFAMQLISFLEMEYQLEVENKDLDTSNFSSIHAIKSFVKRKLAG